MQKLKGITEKCSEAFVGLYRYSVSWIFFAIILFLSSVSLISTTILTREWEGGHFYIGDHPIIVLILIAVIIRIGLFLNSKAKGKGSRTTKSGRAVKDFFDRINNDEAFFKKIRFRMLLALGIVAVLWVLSTQIIPNSDQYRIQEVVGEMHVENYVDFQPRSYFYKYQNQNGLTLLCYLFSYIFGSSNYVVFCLFNAAALVFFFYSLSDMCGSFEFGRPAQLSVILFGFAFYPLIIYCSFIYGTLGGLAFGVAAMNMEMKFFRGQKLRHAILCAVFIALSAAIKSNYMVFLAAIAICAVVELVRRRKLKLLVLPAAVAAAAVLSSAVPEAILSDMTGVDFDGGASPWGWVVLGLSESERAPGAFNYSNVNLYEEANFEHDKHAELSKEAVAERLKYFAENKDYAVSFFVGKTIYQWNDPTFQSAWNIRERPSQNEISDWFWYFKSPEGSKLSMTLLNPLLSIIYIGALLFCVLCRNKTNLYILILPMTFIGGFVFHMFWEAAPRYTLPYFVLLFPLTVAGYSKAVLLISDKMNSKAASKSKTAKEKKEFMRNFLSFVPYLCITVVMVSMTIPFSGEMKMLSADSEGYAAWIERNSIKPLVKEGEYTITSKSGSGITSKPDDELAKKADVTLSSEPTPVKLVFYQGVYRFKFPEGNLFLSVTNDGDKKTQTVNAERHTRKDTQDQWKLEESKDGYKIIYDDKYLLTRDEKAGTVYVAADTGKQDQIWYFEKQ